MVDEAHATGALGPGRARRGRRGRARRRGRRDRRHARQGAGQLRRLRVREPRDHRAARQHGAPVHLLDRACRRRRSRAAIGGAGADRGAARAGRPPAAQRRDAARRAAPPTASTRASRGPRSSRWSSATPSAAVALCERALERGVFAQAIRPPTVPEGTSRLRLTVMATHRAGRAAPRRRRDRRRSADEPGMATARTAEPRTRGQGPPTGAAQPRWPWPRSTPRPRARRLRHRHRHRGRQDRRRGGDLRGARRRAGSGWRSSSRRSRARRDAGEWPPTTSCSPRRPARVRPPTRSRRTASGRRSRPHLGGASWRASDRAPALLGAARGAAAARPTRSSCEGVGGLLVPLTPGYLVRDLAVDLGLPLVIAARPGSGRSTTRC